MESRPTTPVPDDCPVCLDPLRSGYARVNWCARHGLCRECAERIYSGGDHRCPLCRVPWFPEHRIQVLFSDTDSIYFALAHELPGRNDPVDIRANDPTNVVMTMQDVYAALTTSVRARVAEALATDDDNALEDMTWAPEGDAPSDDDDPYVRQWNADNADDVPPHVRAYGVSF